MSFNVTNYKYLQNSANHVLLQITTHFIFRLLCKEGAHQLDGGLVCRQPNVLRGRSIEIVLNVVNVCVTAFDNQELIMMKHDRFFCMLMNSYHFAKELLHHCPWWQRGLIGCEVENLPQNWNKLFLRKYWRPIYY